MIDLAKLLAPVRDDAPCGDDPLATGVLFELETLAAGKPETQFSAAEEPEWKAVQARALEIAGECKDLRVAAILAAALLRTRGVAGLRDGLQLVEGYVRDFWETVHPQLDPDDDNDPLQRINALATLAAPIGSDGDPLRVVAAVRATPLLAAPRAGRFSLQHYLAVKGTEPWPESAGAAPTASLLEAALQEAPAEEVGATVEAVTAVIDLLGSIEDLFRAKAGPTAYPGFEPLRRELKHALVWLAVAAPDTAAAAAAAGGAGASGGGVGEGSGAAAGLAGPGFSGSVRNRGEVRRALESVIAYYRAVEPSSPVPYLLRRALRLVEMDFLAVIMELTPESREKIISIVGSLDENGSSGDASQASSSSSSSGW